MRYLSGLHVKADGARLFPSLQLPHRSTALPSETPRRIHALDGSRTQVIHGRNCGFHRNAPLTRFSPFGGIRNCGDILEGGWQFQFGVQVVLHFRILAAASRCIIPLDGKCRAILLARCGSRSL